jgi:hypothetical protein
MLMAIWEMRAPSCVGNLDFVFNPKFSLKKSLDLSRFRVKYTENVNGRSRIKTLKPIKRLDFEAKAILAL